jgi:ribosome-associated heat shock protein Hsp15
MNLESLRIDKWLWYARFCKSRNLATQLCKAGRVRINKIATKKPNQQIHVGDVLTFPAGHNVRVIRIIALGVRRGPAAEAQTLYEDLAPIGTPAARAHTRVGDASREPGSGRPTKRDRRILDRWRRTG